MTHIEITESGEVHVNGFSIVNLKNPFRSIINLVDNKRPASFYERKPSKTLSTKRMLSYNCNLGYNYYGELFRLYSNPTLKYHSIYKIYPTVSQLFSIRVLERIIRNEDVSKEVFKQFHTCVDKVVETIANDFPFDAIVSDFSMGIPNLVNINSLLWNLTSIRNKYLNNDLLVLDTMLRTYKKVPLNVLNSVLEYITLEETDININSFKPFKNILIVSGTNGYYSSFLAKLIYKKFPTKEVLPISIFSFNKNILGR